LILVLLCTAAPAWAISVVVDVDTGTPGIQSSINVPLGTPVTVNVVVVGDGSSEFGLINVAPTSIPSPIAPEKVSRPGGGPGRPPRLSWRYARRPLELEGDQAWNRREKRHQKKRMVLLVPRL